MTTPTVPPFPLPASVVPGAVPPEPPPAPPPPPEPPPPPAPDADSADELRAALAAERRAHLSTQQSLAEARRTGMTADQRRLDDARQEGRTEAIRENGVRVAAESFRAAAKGRLHDREAIEAALEALDLSRFVNAAGDVDRDGIAALVERLAPPAPSGAQIPAGSRGAPPDGDFLRAQMGQNHR